MMANQEKKTLSKNLSQMKFMKRRSNDPLGKDDTDLAGALIEKWTVPNIPMIKVRSQGVEVLESFMECEDLNRLGRFSYNKFNKEIERLSECYTKGEQDGDGDGDGDGDEEDGTIPAHEVARRYEEITSKKFLGKHQREQTDFSPGPPGKKGRHVFLENRVSRMDKDGFLKPT